MTNKSLLVVDDSATMRQLLCMTLTRVDGITQANITEASDGAEALDKVRTGSFDLVLTDQNMPRMDGLTLIRSLRAMAAYQLVPVLMLTTESSDDMKARGRTAGANGWLVKPFDPLHLLEAVKKVIG